ncbi:hypothetical protein GUITHDRAFT_102642 [Guillardia theta CCMP2712]|uniref:2-oxo-4-hydroxy-4-carboxy-5-ureidoimidazoline decarboxylase n=2 Tax=Guillardia theta TaxID=55529 RepID=L1JS44_GUITC|nr:hypothetical protein GUITHDRAFT_102642 [Guillardia theta CCMP2712]EKX51371.1 hypothetical protein GUITHDRAFT_102642 [Guillardia theta CCMP2712]|eukprot:XP_005838351.1 hypothetical protein GUITHDRAFT_102642 [Guillardia theta CCMP2712]
MTESRPFSSPDDMKLTSDRIWSGSSREDILEAFEAHPRIGDKKGAEQHGGKWASNEQKGMDSASNDIARAMMKGNAEYEARMGFRYIVCATGKSAEEMLQILKMRVNNAPDEELKTGAAEQNKITHLRLNKLLSELSTSNL